MQLVKQSFCNLMTETATEIYCRLNDVQEIQSEMDTTNDQRCFRMQTKSPGRGGPPILYLYGYVQPKGVVILKLILI